MKAPTPRNQPTDLVILHRRTSPLVYFFIAMPVLIVLMVGVVVLSNRLPIFLTLLLLAVTGSCLFWIKLALGNAGDVTIELTAAEMKVKTMLGGVSYPWSRIETVKLVDPGPSLADNGQSDGARIGIGVYFRTTVEREPDALPDEVLFSGTAEAADAIMKGAERIIAFHKRIAAGGGGGDRAGSAFGKQNKPFRRQAKAA